MDRARARVAADALLAGALAGAVAGGLLGGVVVGTVAGPALPAGAAGCTARPWLDRRLGVEPRVSALLACLTLPEKVSQLYGVAPPPSSGPVGYVPGISRLGVPPLRLSDGPLGLRDSVRAAVRRPATALPAGVALAAAFDPSLALRHGALLGDEARARGVDVLYGPGLNTVRVPQAGRDFEYLGEDPYLAARLAAQIVQGVQGAGIAAQVKHFALNDQERDRDTTSSEADERTMREIYLPPFEAAVRTGGAWSVMCATNLVNGVHACEDPALLQGVLRADWGFDGVVGSDYQATHSAGPSLAAGLDQSFTLLQWGRYYDQLVTLVRQGQVPGGQVDAAARRVLRLRVRVGQFDARPAPPPVDVAGHAATARRVAQESAVLLKNTGVLPLSPAATRSIAVVGPHAASVDAGGGSSRVVPYSTVTAVDGLRARLGAGTTVTTADGSDVAAAVALARAADVAVVVVGDQAQEGVDRPGLALPGAQDQLVASVAAANPRTVVVLQTGAPVTMPWLAGVPAVLETWYPGEQAGAALAALLVGDVAPSGKLPVTFPTDGAHTPTSAPPRYPAVAGVYRYTERLQVGYRWYDAQGRAPLFPFGFGLSYTTFDLHGARVTSPPGILPVQVSVDVTDTGSRPGTDVVQAYVQMPVAAGEPPHQLKAFARVTLAPGQTRRVTLTLDARAFSVWDVAAHGWVVPPGTHQVLVGDSSRSLLPGLPVALTARLVA